MIKIKNGIPYICFRQARIEMTLANGKQLGTYQAKQMKLWDNHGGIPEDWPQEFQVRQMPDYKAVPYTEPQYTLKF